MAFNLNPAKVETLVAILNEGTKLTNTLVERTLRITRPDYVQAYKDAAIDAHASRAPADTTAPDTTAPDTTAPADPDETPAPKPAAAKKARKRATPAPAPQPVVIPTIVLREKNGNEVELEVVRQTASTILVQHVVPDVRRVILQGKSYNVDVKALKKADPAANYGATTLTNEQVLAAALVA